MIITFKQKLILLQEGNLNFGLLFYVYSNMQYKDCNMPEFPIGEYDKGLLYSEHKMSLDKKTTVDSKDKAIDIARKDPGAEFIVERKNKGTFAYDVYKINIDDKDSKIATANDLSSIEFVDKPFTEIDKKTGTKDSKRGYIVAENGQVSEPVYRRNFDKTNFDTVRNALGLQTNKVWNALFDKVSSVEGSPGEIPLMDRPEIEDMVSKTTKGDVILCGNSTFIHAILYVGKDPALQAQLEKKWNMPKGSLADEHLIIHSLSKDKDKEVTVNGKKEIYKGSGDGVQIDSIERYIKRHPRDAMMAMSVKDATSKDRDLVVNEAKKFIGIPYDAAFDTFDDSAMYCTEFVAKAWMASPHSPNIPTQKHALISPPDELTKKLPSVLAKRVEDRGIIHNEMYMTDGFATSPDMEPVWASKDMDKTNFIKKHTRWIEGLKGQKSESYKESIQENEPDIVPNSNKMIEKIKTLSAETKNNMNQFIEHSKEKLQGIFDKYAPQKFIVEPDSFLPAKNDATFVAPHSRPLNIPDVPVDATKSQPVKIKGSKK